MPQSPVLALIVPRTSITTQLPHLAAPAAVGADMQMTLRWMLEQQGPLHRVDYSFEWGPHGWEAVQTHDAGQPAALVQGSS